MFDQAALKGAICRTPQSCRPVRLFSDHFQMDRLGRLTLGGITVGRTPPGRLTPDRLEAAVR
jgi:hypothetical protein